MVKLTELLSLFLERLKKEVFPTRASELPPNHLIHHPDIALDNAYDFGGDVLVHVVRHRDAREAVADEGDGHIDALEEAGGVDAAEDEATLIQGLGPFGRSPDADGRKRVSDARKERAFLRQSTTIRHHAECIHLQAIIVMKAHGLVLYNAPVQLKS